ncbi:MAG TPA: hypothetical protein VGD65_18625 [Chryseosolibacter sp.]
MKFFLRALALSILTFSCKDEVNTPIVTELNPQVGAQIPLETATRWTQRLDEKRGQFSRSKTQETIPSQYLCDYLRDINSQLGAAVHYGLDSEGEVRLLIIKYDQNAHWAETALDTKSKITVTKSIAREYCDRYKASNATGPWSYFYGRNILSAIVDRGEFESFALVPAINDLDEPQLLLYIWLNQVSNGKIAQSEPEVYDKGFPCPTNCADEN